MRFIPAAAILLMLAAPISLDWAATAGAAGREAPPAEAPEEADLGVVAVARVNDDGTIALADGRSLRLAEIDLLRGRVGRAARAAVMELAAAGAFTLRGDGPVEDRYGRVDAQAYAADGRWVQGELVYRGLARVATSADHCAMASQLLAIERIARAHGAELWDNPEYALRSPEQAATLTDTWQVVEGKVAKARTTRSGLYLDFGADPAHDLAVRIPLSVARNMEFDPTALAGHKIRVRGWIGKTIGPLITLDHPEQIEALGHPRRVAAQ